MKSQAAPGLPLARGFAISFEATTRAWLITPALIFPGRSHTIPMVGVWGQRRTFLCSFRTGPHIE